MAKIDRFAAKNGRHFENWPNFEKKLLQFFCHHNVSIWSKFQLHSTFLPKVDPTNVKCQFSQFEVRTPLSPKYNVENQCSNDEFLPQHYVSMFGCLCVSQFLWKSPFHGKSLGEQHCFGEKGVGFEVLFWANFAKINLVFVIF